MMESAARVAPVNEPRTAPDMGYWGGEHRMVNLIFCNREKALSLFRSAALPAE